MRPNLSLRRGTRARSSEGRQRSAQVRTWRSSERSPPERDRVMMMMMMMMTMIYDDIWRGLW